MRSFVFLLIVATQGASVTPVQKVIQLLNGMLAKGQKEKQAEQVQFAAYNQFCEDTAAEKTTAIKESNRQITSLKAAIQKYDAEVVRLTDEIAGHVGDIDCWNGDKKSSTSVRKIEREDYTGTHKDYTESIDALSRAIVVLKKQSHDRKQAGSALMQIKNLKLIPDDSKKIMDGFLQDMGEDNVGLDVEAPEANGYEFQSQSVVDMLQKLHDKFLDERTTLEKEEANSKHAYEMLMQDLEYSIKTADEAKTSKTTEKATNAQSSAAASGDLSDEINTRNSDQAYLDDLNATCAQKSGDFKQRQELRTDEMEAIEKATEILSSGNVSGNADKYLPAFAQRSLLQVTVDNQSPQQKRVVAFLTKQANKYNSRLLSALVQTAKEDPFTKVKKMVFDLITRLEEEANAEAEHKGWCDTELAKNEHTRKEKTSNVEMLKATIDEKESSVAKLTKQIAEATSEVANIEKALAEATQNRKDEKFTNGETVKDSQEAQTAVAEALTVLKEFYAKAAEATALIQAPADAPAIFDAPYKGMQGENGGVLGMLEVIQSDFARLETETKAAEATAQKEYDNFVTDSRKSKAQKQTDKDHHEANKAADEQTLSESTVDLDATQKELDAALSYYDKLKPSCIDAGVSFEDRVARRRQEMESLQEALDILSQ